MKLFEIAGEFRALRDILENDIEFDEETGEITDTSLTIQSLYNEIALKLSDKLDNSAYVVKNLETTSKALKEEAKRLSDRAKQLQDNADKLKQLMEYALIESGEDKLKTDKFTFSFRNSESLSIEDSVMPSDLPSEFVRVKYEFDKVSLKEALKNGELFDGVSISKNKSFTIK
jgi:seryl-tRNA synthetase